MKYVKLYEEYQFDSDFYEWFKGSKVVDSEGNPLIVYHGTPFKFSEFDRYYSGKNYGNTFGKGIYFGTSEGYAKNFIKVHPMSGIPDTSHSYIIEAYLNIKNPLIVNSVIEYRDIISNEKKRKSYKDGRYNLYLADKINSKEDNEILIDMGYDGVMFYSKSQLVEIICFSKNQIKIIKNTTLE